MESPVSLQLPSLEGIHYQAGRRHTAKRKSAPSAKLASLSSVFIPQWETV